MMGVADLPRKWRGLGERSRAPPEHDHRMFPGFFTTAAVGYWKSALVWEEGRIITPETLGRGVPISDDVGVKASAVLYVHTAYRGRHPLVRQHTSLTSRCPVLGMGSQVATY